jgi:hypothetical protein
MAVLLQHELLELESETFEVIDIAELSNDVADLCSTSCCSCSCSSCCSCSCTCGSTTSTTSSSSGSTSSCA